MSNTTFQIGKDKYTVRDLTIQDYYDMQLELTLSDQNSGFNVVSKLADCPTDQLKKLGYDQWLALWITVQNQINRNIKLDEEVFSPKVKVNGVNYGMINLDNITLGEFSDLDVILNSTKAESRMHEAMAVLYRPIVEENGKKYKIADYDSEEFADRAEEFKSFPLAEARVAITFFLRLGSRSLEAMADSLNQQLQEMKSQMPEEMQRITEQIQTKLLEVGTQLSSQLQVTIHSKSTKPRLSRLERHLIGWLTGLINIRNKNLKLRKKSKNIDLAENDN
jgi:hypothetical protein